MSKYVSSLIVKDGSATKPGIMFECDTNSGLYQKADNNISVAIDGSEQANFNADGLQLNNELRLSGSSGYVGIQAGSTSTSYTLTLPTVAGGTGTHLQNDGSGTLTWVTDAGGDVSGPASATDNAIVRYDTTTGKLIQNSGIIIDDSDNVSGVVDLTSTGQFLGAAGSATTPTYSFSGATGVGMYEDGGNLHLDGTCVVVTDKLVVDSLTFDGSSITNTATGSTLSLLTTGAGDITLTPGATGAR